MEGGDYEEKYYTVVKDFKLKEIEIKRLHVEIEEKNGYIEDLERKLRVMNNDRKQPSSSMRNHNSNSSSRESSATHLSAAIEAIEI